MLILCYSKTLAGLFWDGSQFGLKTLIYPYFLWSLWWSNHVTVISKETLSCIFFHHCHVCAEPWSGHDPFELTHPLQPDIHTPSCISSPFTIPWLRAAARHSFTWSHTPGTHPITQSHAPVPLIHSSLPCQTSSNHAIQLPTGFSTILRVPGCFVPSAPFGDFCITTTALTLRLPGHSKFLQV